MGFGAPKGFISIDVSNARDNLLIEQCSLNLDVSFEVIRNCCIFVEEWVKWIGGYMLGRCWDPISDLLDREPTKSTLIIKDEFLSAKILLQPKLGSDMFGARAMALVD